MNCLATALAFASGEAAAFEAEDAEDAMPTAATATTTSRTAAITRTARGFMGVQRATPPIGHAPAAAGYSSVIETRSEGVASTSARPFFGSTRRTSSNRAGESPNRYGRI